MVDRIRLSIGTALKFGLESGPSSNHFTTAFLMTYSDKKCDANCVFCPQARSSSSDQKLLSRIGWPVFEIDEVISRFKQNLFQRICIQTLNYDEVIEHTEEIIKRVRKKVETPISVCIHPINKQDMQTLKNAGAERIGIAVDACTEEIFDAVKGKKRGSDYRWNSHIKALVTAQDIFGKKKVTTHLMVGLGETERDAAHFLFRMAEMDVRVGLFAFTPVKGTTYENRSQPDIGKYRRLQILKYLIDRQKISEQSIGYTSNGKIEFRMETKKLIGALKSGAAFQVTGCPGCNRPYYNERPRGEMYNYPRKLVNDEVSEALKEAGLVK